MRDAEVMDFFSFYNIPTNCKRGENIQPLLPESFFQARFVLSSFRFQMVKENKRAIDGSDK